MKPNVFLWIPRTLAILFIAFISIFALDVLGEPRWPVALLMHLLPSFALILLTLIAWKHMRIGGVLFILASMCLFFFFHSALVALPALVIGLLFTVASANARSFE